MDKILMLTLTALLVTACDDSGRSHASARGIIMEQRLFDSLTVTRIDSTPSAAAGETTAVALVLSSDRGLTRRGVLRDAAGKELATFCEETGSIETIAFQDLLEQIATADLINYRLPDDIACAEASSSSYEVSYAQMNEKKNTVSAAAEACPLPEPLGSIVTELEAVAEKSLEPCTPDAIPAENVDPAEGEEAPDTPATEPPAGPPLES